MNRYFSVLMSALWIFAIQADASDQKQIYSKKYISCMQQVFTTADVIACAEDERMRLERKLIGTYDNVKASLPPSRQKALAKTQRAWHRYRDEKCRFLYDKTTGSGGLEDMQICFLNETKRRIRELLDLP